MTAISHSRIELAKQQLEDALVLFLDQSRYASAITLAGASEEIFGRYLQRNEREAAMDWKLTQINCFQTALDGGTIERREFIEAENRVRNALKHIGTPSDGDFVADLQEAACWMLVRACENASRLDIEVDRTQEFNDWFISNVVGI